MSTRSTVDGGGRRRAWRWWTLTERQRVALSNAAGWTFRLAFKGYATAPIAYNASGSVVESALEALPSIDDVTVTGSAGGPWTVTFVGAHSGKNEPELEGDASGATSGTLERTFGYTFDDGAR